MTFLKRLSRWLAAMDDVEDPRGAELRRLHQRVRVLERSSGAPEVDAGTRP